MTLDELKAVQLYWMRYWLPVVYIGFLAGIVVGIGIGRLIEMYG